MPVTAGRRDEVIRIFDTDSTSAGQTDDHGDLVESTSDVIPEYHCSIVSLTIKEVVSAQGETPRQRYKVSGLYEPIIDETMLVAWDNGGGERVFEIENVDHIRDLDTTNFLMTWAKR